MFVPWQAIGEVAGPQVCRGHIEFGLPFVRGELQRPLETIDRVAQPALIGADHAHDRAAFTRRDVPDLVQRALELAECSSGAKEQEGDPDNRRRRAVGLACIIHHFIN